MPLRLHVIRIVALFAAVIPSTSSQAQEELGDRVKRLAQPYIDAKIVMGMSIGVLKDGKQATVHLGRISSDGPKPDDKTIYEIGSVSKVFTGVLLADAVNREELRLDQTAQELSPEGTEICKWNDRDFTLAELATHTSGLPRLADNMPSVMSDNPYSDYTSKLAYEFLGKHKLSRAPGEKHEYSNVGASFLGHLIAARQEKSYDQLLAERIAAPLEMNDTKVQLTDSMKKRLATPHLATGKPSNNWDFADMPGAGGIRSSTGDMLRFAKANIAPPDNKIGQALELAWQEHYDGKGGGRSMGLCWHFAADGSTRWHNGQTGGFHSMLLVNRQLGLAVVVLANTATMEVDRLANDVIVMLAGGNVQPRKFEESIEVAPKIMQRYVGRYQLAPGFVFTVSVQNKNLMVGVTGQPTLQVFPRSETEWFYKVVDATLTFQVNDEGKSTAVELFQNGVRQMAQRIE